MSVTWTIGVDWRRKGVICHQAQPGDALNLLPNPLRYTESDWRSTLATSVSRTQLATDYGFFAFTIETGTGTGNGFVLGQDNALTVDDIAVSASTAYSVGVWLRGQSGFSGVDFILRVKDQTGATLATGSAFTLSADWQQQGLSFSTGAGSTHISIEIIKDNDATDVTFQAAGFMLVAGSTLPSGYNAGATVDLYDNITSKVIDADWVIGFHQPFEDVSASTELKLTLNNTDRRFSPEYAPGDSSNPLEGYLKPLRPLVIYSDDGTTRRTHWSGWLEEIRPAPHQYGERRAEFKATGVERFLSNVEVALELQQNKRSDEILAALLATFALPQPLFRSTLLDVTEHSELGVNTLLQDTTPQSTLETGKTTLAYAADNWVKRSGDAAKDTFNIYAALKDIVSAERGRFHFDRSGAGQFWNRHHTLVNTTVQASFDDTMQDLMYVYADKTLFTNDVTVVAHPRSISAGTAELLWQLDKAVEIEPGTEKEIGAAFRDESDNRIGGINPYLANIAFSSGDADISITEFQANKVTIRLHNRSNRKAVLSQCEVRGQKITDFGRMEAQERDEESVNRYGEYTMTLNLKALDNLENAEQVALFELGRRSTPQGRIEQVTLRSHGMETGSLTTQQLSRVIGDVIALEETQLGHSDEYVIIGEQHKLTDHATNWGNCLVSGTLCGR